jgi:hypothetical protein
MAAQPLSVALWLRLDPGQIKLRTGLPVSTATMTAPTVSAASAVKTTAASCATVESATAANRATVEPTSRATCKAASPYNPTATCEATSADEAPATVVAATIAPSAATPTPAPPAVPTPPRASADKQSTRKPARSVVAVRRTGVGIIIVVAVRAYRLHSYANRDLRLRIRQRQHQNCDQSQIFHIPHGVPLVPDPCSNPQPPNLQVFWILSLSEAPMYLNSDPGKKLQERQWLISATLPEISHLRGAT